MERFDHCALQPKAFQHLDDPVNSFDKIRDVVSDRMFGDPHTAETPWLSVVLPTFHRDGLFREALESILNQRPVDYSWELLVVDNTPLDSAGDTPALKVIRGLNDPRVLYYHNRQNIDTGYNWNRGAQLARGKWLCFLHDDDILFPDALCNIGRQISDCRGKKPLGYLHARRLDFVDVPSTIPQKYFPPERLTRFGVLLSGCTGAGSPTCGTTILRQAYIETGGINYDFGLSADAVLCYQIMQNYAVICSDRILGGYRWQENDTLHKENFFRMIQSDELLSHYTYERSRFARCWGQMFGAASTWRNIFRKQKLAAQNDLQITEQEFQTVTAYPKPGICKRELFLALYVTYRLLRWIDGMVQEARYREG